MQDKITLILLGQLGARIVKEQKAACFPAGRGRTMMIENRSYLVVVGIMIGSLTQKVPQPPLTQHV